MLTPEEISSRKFLNALRGYDRLEVSEFLNEVAEDYRDLLERVRELEAREERRTATGGQYDPREAIGELGEETKRILLAAEEAAEEKRTHAEEEARTHLEDARKTAADELEQARSTAAEELDAARRKAQETVAAAQERREEIVAAINELVESRDRFSSQLREAADAVLETLRRVESLDQPDTGAGVAEEETAEVPLEDTGLAEEAGEAAPAEAPPEPAEEAAADETVERPSAQDRDAGDDGEPSGNVTVLEADTDRADERVRPGEDGPDIVQAGADAAKLRDTAVASIRPDMVQELKDAIQGMQRGLLDRLREAQDEESTVTPSDEEAEQLEVIGRSYLSQAYRAGLSTGAALAQADSDDVKGLDSRVEEGAGELRDAIVNELRSALSTTLREGAEHGESASQLSKRVKRSVRQLRNAVAEAAASTSLLRLHELGVHDAWSDLDVPARAWQVSDEEAECPDDVCAANAAEGAVALDAAFPSGDLTPPAHPGCVCTLDPA